LGAPPGQSPSFLQTNTYYWSNEHASQCCADLALINQPVQVNAESFASVGGNFTSGGEQSITTTGF